MIILGIDPGIARCGYGIIEEKHGVLSLVDYGLIETDSSNEDIVRLKEIFERTNNLIEQFSPSIMAVEQLFYGSNSRTAFAVGQARGVVLLAAALSSIKTAEYTPLQVKQAVVGYGRAEKNQIQYMVKELLKMAKTPKQDDAADALAVAICHAHSYRIKEKLEVK